MTNKATGAEVYRYESDAAVEWVGMEFSTHTHAELAAPDVHVGAPVVNVAAPVVNNTVRPTPVTVQNDVQPAAVQLHLPSRKTETQLERDQYGNLVKATQIERDAE